MQPSVHTVHRAADGTPILTYLAASDGDRPAAYDLEVVGSGDGTGPALAVAVETVITDLAGWTVSTTVPFGDLLAAGGAQVRRRLDRMGRQFDVDPAPESWADAPLGAGVRAVPATRPAAEVFPAWRAAFSVPGHPDRFNGTDAEALGERLGPLLSGAEGAVLPWSRLAVDAHDRVVAGVVMIDVGVPWIGDVFRLPGPEHAGLGAALLRRVLHAAAAGGVTSVGLSVTEGNPAGNVYRRLGFRTARSLVTVHVPGEAVRGEPA